MKIFRSLNEIPASFGPTVATMGNFDGVHIAHRWVIAEVNARRSQLAARSVAITFDPHPTRILRPEAARPLITPLAQKLELLASTGIDAVLVLPFTGELSRLSAREFASLVLRDKLRALEVHEGENFRFGYRAEVGVDGLTQLGAELGFWVQVFAPQSMRGHIVSSSRVRELIATGNLTQARALLGRSFSVRGTPASGRGFGTRYTVPTINLGAYAELLPANGVYVTRMRIGRSSESTESAGSAESAGATAASAGHALEGEIQNEIGGEVFDAVTNVGNRPTFGEDSFTVESHLLDFHPITLSPETPLELTFLFRLRGEARWPTPEALKQQIGRDVSRAQRYFRGCRAVAQRHSDARPDSEPLA